MLLSKIRSQNILTQFIKKSQNNRRLITTTTLNNLISPKKFDDVTSRLRTFFHIKGFVEVHTQNRLSILAACEDPFTISTYNYGGEVWPLPQTGQMWLEYELLKNPEYKGLFCLSTSFRNEPNPIEGRHDKIFPMFEFEMHGGMEEMIQMETELLDYLGFDYNKWFPGATYEQLCKKYNTQELEHEHEQQLKTEYGSVFFIQDFPEYTSPFWNMARYPDSNISKKVDVIINGIETIGSAERSCDVDDMRQRFLTISNGDYSKTLFSGFTKERVEKELDDFLSFDFFPRSGGGIGVTRLISGMEENGLLKP
jgi:aspartyl/asparaginyl-tRNA synthetase